MPKQLVEYEIESGGRLLVEVEVPDPARGTVPASRRDGVLIKATETYDQCLAAVKPAVDVTLSMLKGLAQVPTELELEFGIKLTAETGAILASAGTEAHLKVTLTWKQDLPGHGA